MMVIYCPRWNHLLAPFISKDLWGNNKGKISRKGSNEFSMLLMHLKQYTRSVFCFLMLSWGHSSSLGTLKMVEQSCQNMWCTGSQGECLQIYENIWEISKKKHSNRQTSIVVTKIHERSLAKGDEIKSTNEQWSLFIKTNCSDERQWWTNIFPELLIY